MSAYITLMTPMTDQECLLTALADHGFDKTKIEVHDTPVKLVGYNGGRRSQTANIVVRRQHLGSPSDVGFLSTATGYQASISDDSPKFGASWLSKLNHTYQQHWSTKQELLAAEERRRLEEERKLLVEAQRQGVHERAKKMGYRIKESVEGDTIRMVLIKRTY